MANMKCAISPALSPAGVNLAFYVAEGKLFGPDVAVDLALIDRADHRLMLEGLMLELQDMASSSLSSVEIGSDQPLLLQDADAVFLISQDHVPGESKEAYLLREGAWFQLQGYVLQSVARKETKVAVMGESSNTLCHVLLSQADEMDSSCFGAVSLHEEWRSRALLHERSGVSLPEIHDLYVLGAIDELIVPDWNSCRLGTKHVEEVVEVKWLEGEYIESLRGRSGRIKRRIGHMPSHTIASAALVSMRCMLGLDKRVISLGMKTKLFHDELVISIPCQFQTNRIAPVACFQPDESTYMRLADSINLLKKEREIIRVLLKK